MHTDFSIKEVSLLAEQEHSHTFKHHLQRENCKIIVKPKIEPISNQGTSQHLSDSL